jgi:hypothetical protein
MVPFTVYTPPDGIVSVPELLIVSVLPLAILLPEPAVLMLITPVVTLTALTKLPLIVKVLAPDVQVTLPVVPFMVSVAMVCELIPVKLIALVPAFITISSVMVGTEAGLQFAAVLHEPPPAAPTHVFVAALMLVTNTSVNAKIRIDFLVKFLIMYVINAQI